MMVSSQLLNLSLSGLLIFFMGPHLQCAERERAQTKMEIHSNAACAEVKQFCGQFRPTYSLSEGSGEVQLKTHFGFEKRNGCRVEITGAFPGYKSLPGDKLTRWFQDQEWTHMELYDADGANGSQSGHFKNGAFCLVQSKDNGQGLDGPPPTFYQLDVTCVGARLVSIVE